MDFLELKAELCVKSIELQQAIDSGLSHKEIIKIYKEVKELQYQLTMAEIEEDE